MHLHAKRDEQSHRCNAGNRSLAKLVLDEFAIKYFLNSLAVCSVISKGCAKIVKNT